MHSKNDCKLSSKMIFRFINKFKPIIKKVHPFNFYQTLSIHGKHNKWSLDISYETFLFRMYFVWKIDTIDMTFLWFEVHSEYNSVTQNRNTKKHIKHFFKTLNI